MTRFRCAKDENCLRGMNGVGLLATMCKQISFSSASDSDEGKAD